MFKFEKRLVKHRLLIFKKERRLEAKILLRVKDIGYLDKVLQVKI